MVKLWAFPNTTLNNAAVVICRGCQLSSPSITWFTHPLIHSSIHGLVVAEQSLSPIKPMYAGTRKHNTAALIVVVYSPDFLVMVPCRALLSTHTHREDLWALQRSLCVYSLLPCNFLYLILALGLCASQCQFHLPLCLHPRLPSTPVWIMPIQRGQKGGLIACLSATAPLD